MAGLGRVGLCLLVVAALSLIGCEGGVTKHAPITVYIEATPEEGIEPLQVQFTAILEGIDEGAQVEYLWDFGDGSSPSTGATPGHTYAQRGDFNVSVQVSVGPREGLGEYLIHVDPFNKGIDLVIDDVTVDPPQINPGGTVAVKVKVTNAGTDPVENGIVVRLFALDSATWPGSANPTGAINIGGLQGEASVEMSGIATVPAGAQDGPHYLHAYVDGPDVSAIDETDENNNVRTTALPFDVTKGPLPIDLVVESVATDLAGAPAVAGNPVTLTTFIRNLGVQKAEKFRLGYRISVDPDITMLSPDQAFGELIEVDGVLDGEVKEVQTTFDVPFGLDNRPFYLGVFLDVVNQVPEQDETNNALFSEIIQIQGANGCTEDALEPNETQATAVALAAGSHNLTVCPLSEEWFEIPVDAGDRLTVTATFDTNDADLGLSLHDAAATLSTSNGTSGSETVISPLATAASTYSVRAIAGGNNTGAPYVLDVTKVGSGGNGKDLVPDQFFVAPNPAGTGEPLTISFDAFNFGTEDITQNTTAELYLSADNVVDAADTLVGSVVVGPVDTMDKATLFASLTVPTSVPPGTYNAILVLDSLNDLTETIENNNTLSQQVDVDLGCVEDIFEPNQSLTSGPDITSGSFSARSCPSNYDYYAVQVPAGRTINVDILFSDAEGNISARLRTPTGGYLDSSFTSTDNENLNYTNNTGVLQDYVIQVYLSSDDGAKPGNPYTMDITGAISPTPDLYPNSVIFTPNNADPGEGIDITYTVDNLSLSDTGNFDVTLYLSPDLNFDATDIPLVTVPTTSLTSLEQRAHTEKVSVPSAASGSQHYVLVVADSNDVISEPYELNNYAFSPQQLDVNSVCVEDIYEENDTPSQAATLGVSTFGGLQVCPKDDDWYAFTASANAMADIRIDFTNSNGDLDLLIYEDDGATLIGSSVSGSNDFEEVSFTATAGQTYLVRAKGFNDAQNGYSLQINN